MNGLIFHNRVFIGHQGYSAIAEQDGLINIEPGGRLVFEGTARFAQGIRLWIDKDATISVGDNFYCNKNCLFRAFDNISIGKDVLMGWDIELNTTDGHHIIVEGKEKTNHDTIMVGNHVWISSHTRISKGAIIPDNSVITQHSLVNSKFYTTNVLLGGIPARELKNDIQWNQ